MFLKHAPSGELVEVLDLIQLTNPLEPAVLGRLQCGEELPDAETFEKSQLCFPSGETLPRAWVDVHYRDAETYRHYQKRA